MQPKLIYDPIHGNIELSTLEIQILKSPFTNRLHQILQNSTAYLVFPACKTSRFEHSVGVLDYSSELFLNGIKNSNVTLDFLNDKSLLLTELIKSNTKKILNNFHDEAIPENKRSFEIQNALLPIINLKQDTLYKLLTVESNCTALNKVVQNLLGDILLEKKLGITNTNLTPLQQFTLTILFQSVRIYGLLHDIGHLPFSHIFEFALESAHELLSKESLSKSKNETAEKLNIILSKEVIHEEIGKSLVKLILTDVGNYYFKNEVDPTKKALIYFILQCIAITYTEITKEKEDSGLSSLACLINDTIDSDRLDFVQRDGYVSGVNKSAGNVERIIKLLCLTKNSNNKDPYCFQPSIQSLHDVEKLITDRFNIYKYMVNHHAVKRSDYILQKYIENELEKEIEENVDIPFDSKIRDLRDVIDIIISLIKGTDSFHNLKYSIIQLTDYWLLSFLTQKYYDNLYNNVTDFHAILLSEIYENTRSFKSLWKRIYDYRSFISSLGQGVIDARSDFENINLDTNNQQVTKEWWSTKLQLHKFREILSEGDPDKLGRFIIQLLSNKDLRLDWCKKIEVYSNKEVESEGLNILVVKTNIKDGIKDFSLVDNKDGITTYKFSEMSSLPKLLKEEVEDAIKFFAYYRSSSLTDKSLEKISVENAIKKSIIRILQEIIISNFANQKKQTNV